MRKTIRSLTISPETIRVLTDSQFGNVRGGLLNPDMKVPPSDNPRSCRCTEDCPPRDR